MITKRLRAGVLVKTEAYGKQYYFGYLTHPGLEYEIAVAISETELPLFINTFKNVIDPTDEELTRFGLLLQNSDADNNIIYTVKVHLNHGFKDLALYESSYANMVKAGFDVNAINEANVIEQISLTL